MDRMVGMFTMEERNVSSFVMETLGLNDGDQTRLMAVRFLVNTDEDKVMVVGRAFKHIHGEHFVKKFKMCLDEADGVVYILADEDHIASLYRAWKISVGPDLVGFSVVKSIVTRKDSHTDFFGISVRIKVCDFISVLFISSSFLFSFFWFILFQCTVRIYLLSSISGFCFPNEP
jgi:hypothetical protein